ncbi:restriction endonuclease [Cellulosimicrobium sp. Marseille-Q4280]|uniref:restriction endonuclease n=1 Tax=Cellulosimicrobium sp. Marseille-Q4280 TaxID=2937992 RepID=UPI002041401E|nr:restriction endonuclease [Cellulosimicrobium sp. Marseille-Q4280]
MTWTSGEPIATPRQAEEFAAWHLRTLGFADAQVTQASNDGGIDVRSTRILAEVKQLTAVVGRPLLQRLVGARGAQHHLALAFYAANGYSRGAREYAEEMGVALFTYSTLGDVVAVNAPARELEAAAPPPEPATPPRPSARSAARAAYVDAKAKAEQQSPEELLSELADWLEKALLVMGPIGLLLGVGMLFTLPSSDDLVESLRSTLGALAVGAGLLVLLVLIRRVRRKRRRGW